MSITFFVEDAPTHEVPFLDWDGIPMFDDNGSAVMCLQSTLPEVNFTESNVKVIFGTLGLTIPEEEVCGEFKLEDLPDLRRRIIKAVNTDNSAFERKPLITGGELCVVETDDNVLTLGRRLKIYMGGIDGYGIHRRLLSLFDVVEAAQQHKKSVVFC